MLIRLRVDRSLTVGERTFPVTCIEVFKRPKKSVAELRARKTVTLKLEALRVADVFEDAVRVARTFPTAQVVLDGVAVQRLYLRRASTSFDADGTDMGGTLELDAQLTSPMPALFDRSDDELTQALDRACALVEMVDGDSIEISERYYVFGAHSIGTKGVFVDRRNGRAEAMGSGLSQELWIWGYERGLLDEPSGDIVIERVHDLERVLATHQLRRARRELVGATFPVVLEGWASWLIIESLHEAGPALEWHVRPGRAH